jgi:L-seryl-tRNA(Ser) seleniumtransferase
LLAKIRSHPLNRAVRVDKMTVAALEATLELYRDDRLEDIPAHRLLKQSPEELRSRAEKLRDMLRDQGIESAVERTQGQVGGGAMPQSSPVSYACALSTDSPQLLQERLRGMDLPVIARVAEDQVLLDVRCLGEEDLTSVALAVASVV